MKAALLLSAILFMSLITANVQGKSEDKTKSEAKPGADLMNKTNTTPRSSGIMVSGGPVFFLLPLMWMMVHLLHM